MRRRWEKELVPECLAMGITYEEFWESTPRKLNVLIDGYKLKRQVEDEQAWMLGEYVFHAVTVALSNSFRKKGQKAQDFFEVMKEPISKRIETDENGLTEKDKKLKTELLFKNLEIMAANHRLQEK